MRAWATLAGVIALAVVIANLALRPPVPLPLNAPPQAFSADRALPDIQAVAERPHPIRSADQARVRDYLFTRMADMGLAPQLRPVETDNGALFNILGVLPGADRAAPAVLLMAHFDSVAAGPGAADDAAGLAAVLETVRALTAAGPHRRDVMVLLTDGEEPGLYGAKSFFSSDPLHSHVGVVLNLEARGNRGRAVMFETHRQGGAMIGFLLKEKALTGASSLMPDLYRRLPNDTDLTEALKRGHAGLNIAFFDGFSAYHGAADTPANLSLASVQSMGAQVLAMARVLADAPVLPGRAPDQVYGDLMGGPVVGYPPAAGWLILALAIVAICAAGWRALTTGQTSIGGVSAGVGLFALLLVFLGAALAGDGAIRVAVAQRHFAPLLRHSAQALAGAGILAGGIALIWLWLGHGRLRPASLTLGALKVLSLAAIALQLAAPVDAFMLGWPLLLGSLAAAVAVWRPNTPWIAAPLALAALAQLFYWTGLIFSLVGQATPAVLAPFAAVAAALLLPLTPRIGPRCAAIGGLVMALGLGLSLAALRP